MKQEEHQAVLLLGSNIQPEQNIPHAIACLQKQLRVLQASSVWQSAAVGSGGPDFLNCALLVAAPLDASTLKEQVLRPLEVQMGRVWTEDKSSPRPIDIDIIIFDGVLLDPGLWEYAYQAAPIAELLPGYQSASGEYLKDAALRLGPATVTQVFPVQKHVPLKGLYLGQHLLELSRKIGRSVVFADFLTDKTGVIAKADKTGHSQIPRELKNGSDWGLFQELMAQADVVITTGAYFRRLAAQGDRAQDILFQFDAGKPFEMLGNWRLDAGYASRQPDLAVVSRHLDFEFPGELIRSGRKITVLTTDAMAKSARASAFGGANTLVARCGEAGVEGDALVATLAGRLGYRIIMMAGGPSVLELLLAAKCLDILYVTEAQRDIPLDDSAMAQTMLPAGGKAYARKEFSLTHEYDQEDVVAEDGSRMAQRYLRYDRQDIGKQG